MKKIFLLLSLTLCVSVAIAQQNLWGVTSWGGNSNGGTIFKTDLNGENHKVVHSFYKYEGYSIGRNQLVKASNGKFYGMSSGGGLEGEGILFEFDPSNGNYSKKVEFNANNGTNPESYLIEATNGKLYGLTPKGGANNFGTIFEFDPSTSTYTKLYDFIGGTSNGSYPQGALIQANNGCFYGVTSFGGANDKGILFEYNIQTSTLTKKVDFNGTSNGRSARGSLIEDSYGNLYGVTYEGGINDGGVIFKYNISDNTITKLYDFELATGYKPMGSLILASNGLLYGTTTAGNSTGAGSIYSFNLTGNTFSKLYNIDFSIAHTVYSKLFQAANGKLYGLASQGGANDGGVIFEYNITTNIYTNKYDFKGFDGSYPQSSFIQTSDGKLYGMTASGGLDDNGVLFEFDPASNNYAVKVSFSWAPDGKEPETSLIQASNGKIYGVTLEGGSKPASKSTSFTFGVIFELDPATEMYTKKYDFQGATNGSFPHGSLLEVENGILYGTTGGGGNNNNGVIYQYNINNNTYTKKFDLNAPDGNGPRGSLIKAPNGKLYGVTIEGGSYDYGVIFEFDPANSTYTKKIEFDGANKGRYPQDALVLASNGKMYGMTGEGGAYDLGVIFEYNYTSNTYTKLHDFKNSLHTWGSLIQAKNSKLYGLAVQGGVHDYGAIFEFDITSNTFTKLFDFDGTNNGYDPGGTLFQGSNGNLYGMAANGGASDRGVLFEYNITTNTFTKKLDFTGLNGSGPNSALIEATVVKNNPTITWVNPSDIEYGRLLDEQILNATANVEGAFVYTPALGTKLNAGQNQDLSVTFTPSNSSSYNTVSKTVKINVLKANQTISFEAIPAKVMGDSPFDISATSSSGLPVSFTSSNVSVATIVGNTITIVGAGNSDIIASQAGDSNFNPAPNNTQSFVVKSNPTITWENPSDIEYGRLLDVQILNAATNVEGTFAYVPAPGTKLNAGQNQDLSVTFTPSNSSIYNTVSKTVKINVLKANQTILFEAIPAKVMGDSPFDISATSSSGLPVSFSSSNVSVATIVGNTITIVGAGNSDIIASQAGDSNFNTAPNITKSLVVNTANSIDNNLMNDVLVYPNPTSSSLSIKSDKILNHMSIYNILGKLINKISINETSATIDVSSLNNGLYLLVIQCENKTFTRKIEKK